MTRTRLAAVVGVAALLSTGVPVKASAPAEPRVHVVAPGDTLGGIARRYGVTVQAIAAANGLPHDRVTLRRGRRLAIPRAASGSADARRKRQFSERTARNLRESRGPVNLVLAIPDFLNEVAPLFVWPVDGYVTSPFGHRRSGWHRGIDIRAEAGTPVFAAARGLVVVSGVEPRYGRVVKIEHDQGFMTVYAHNDENLVDAGDELEVGDLVGLIGRSGRATAEHLHFEIRRDGRVYNPLYLLPLPPRIGQVEDMEPDEEHE